MTAGLLAAPRHAVANQWPLKLADTGLFEDVDALLPVARARPYEVNAPLWSDGMRKRRWLVLPEGQSIGFHPTGPWTFPIGTALIKHFDLETTSGFLRVETRILMLAEDGWSGASYSWDESQSEAQRVDERLQRTYSVPSGGHLPTRQTIVIPSPQDCGTCHRPQAGAVLGVQTRQLNRPAATGDDDGVNQLDEWAEAGLFSTRPEPAKTYHAFVDPYGSGGLVERARTYIDVNCASCHRPRGSAAGGMDLRYDQTPIGMNVAYVPPSFGNLGVPGAMRVVPRDRQKSVMWLRMRASGEAHMPHIFSRKTDPTGVSLVGSWIDSWP